ncbi:LOW QUALITY PROTEIN: F-box protein At3g57590-like [Capsella rubella]|uniref:LOW QUALITY PROTEIN: F-box protein At3g57590-like n=1 Tax=Capsella rubella TaxID=81985 RepID=UPI000CD599E8|nr:LOW QUALITY PROTEIN: F-box protein At3g57590-like [Capsella rubella]
MEVLLLIYVLFSRVSYFNPSLVFFFSGVNQLEHHKPMISQRNKRSWSSRKRRENLELIPTDVIMEIFSRLPAKSVARFRSLSMLNLPYFTELFLTKSLARPRLLFAINQGNEWLFFSSPQPQNPYEKLSLVATDFHMRFISCTDDISCSYSSGLICIYDCRIQKEGIDKMIRKIQGPPLAYGRCSIGVCINGVLYYIAYDDDLTGEVKVIVCFDVRSEEFKTVDANLYCYQKHLHLVNYKGKLGGISWEYGDDTLKLSMWILEDVEKQQWSIDVYTLPNSEIVAPLYLSVVGVTATGEIVLSMDYTCKPFYVFYYNPKRNTRQRFEIQGFRGFGTDCGVYTFVDYVEDLSLNDAKQLNLSIYTPSMKNKRSLNAITKRPTSGRSKRKGQR